MPDIRNPRIYPGEVTARLRGIKVYNNTGSDMPKGSLIYVSGYDATTRRFKVVLATSLSAGVQFATAVLDRVLTNGASGQAYVGAAVAGLNTSGKTVGDVVYLSTAGGYTYTKPSFNVQPVGFVAVVDATAGVIEFNLSDLGLPAAPGGDGAMLYTEITMTDAQVKAARATPVVLIAAPGVGKVLELVSGTAIFDYTAAYTQVDPTDLLQVRYKDGTGSKASEVIPFTGFLAATADTAVGVEKITTGTPVAKTVCENQALVVHNPGATELGGGNAANVVRIKVAYRVVSTGW